MEVEAGCFEVFKEKKKEKKTESRRRRKDSKIQRKAKEIGSGQFSERERERTERRGLRVEKEEGRKKRGSPSTSIAVFFSISSLREKNESSAKKKNANAFSPLCLSLSSVYRPSPPGSDHDLISAFLSEKERRKKPGKEFCTAWGFFEKASASRRKKNRISKR